MSYMVDISAFEMRLGAGRLGERGGLFPGHGMDGGEGYWEGIGAGLEIAVGSCTLGRLFFSGSRGVLGWLG